jgi:hypothetical protein
MAIQSYIIPGRVENSKTGEGLYNLVIEAWSLRDNENIVSGTGRSNEEGQFRVCLENPDNNLHNVSDVYFKVYRSKKLLSDTRDSVQWNLKTEGSVIIKLNVYEPRTGKDRISTKQVLKATEIFQQSDFSGIYRQWRSHAGITSEFLGNMLKNTIKDLNLEPMRRSPDVSKDVLNQDIEVAQRNLAARNVQVNEVREYNPRLDGNSFSALARYPVRLSEGQRVNLYEENGKVKYYSVTGNKERSSLNMDYVVPSDFQQEMSSLHRSNKEKDEKIDRLQEEQVAMKREMAELRELIKSRNG